MSAVDPVLIPPRDGVDVGDYSLRDFAAKWLFQQCDLAEVGRYREANAALAKDPDPRARVVLIGDSITEFWAEAGNLEGDGWRTVNRGIAGQNATQMLLRFEDDVVSLRPRLAVLLCGTNDLRCYAGPPAAIGAGARDRIRIAVTAMADIAAARGIVLLLSTLPPVGRQPETFRDPSAVRAVNDWVASFARERGLDLVDHYGALADSDGFLSDTLSDDGIHPGSTAYARMMAILREALARHGLQATTGR